MHGERIAILESRAAQQVAALVARHGGTPVSAPALAEVPDADPATVRALIERHVATPPALVIFQTGVGTRALFETAAALNLERTLEAMLARTVVAVRGPKPTAVLRGRSIRIDRAAVDPFTTHELLAAISDVPVEGAAVLVQRYGESNEGLGRALAARGATPVEIPTYRWALPEDTAPLLDLARKLREGTIDAVVFTSASQVRNLFTVAGAAAGEEVLKPALLATRIVSIGPVCSDALRAAGLRVDAEARPPKLGFLVSAIEAALASRSPV
jgi:uroporphyrinogen-III synthase